MDSIILIAAEAITFRDIWMTILAVAVSALLAWGQRQNTKEVRKVGAEAAIKVKEASDKVDQVATTAAAKMAKMVKLQSDIHDLFNSKDGVQKKMLAVALRRLAVGSRLREDESAADLAEQMLAEHEAIQTAINARWKA